MQIKKTSHTGMNFKINYEFKITVKEYVLQIIMVTTVQEVLTKLLSLISNLLEYFNV